MHNMAINLICSLTEPHVCTHWSALHQKKKRSQSLHVEKAQNQLSGISHTFVFTSRRFRSNQNKQTRMNLNNLIKSTKISERCGWAMRNKFWIFVCVVTTIDWSQRINQDILDCFAFKSSQTMTNRVKYTQLL